MFDRGSRRAVDGRWRPPAARDGCLREPGGRPVEPRGRRDPRKSAVTVIFCGSNTVLESRCCRVGIKGSRGRVALMVERRSRRSVAKLLSGRSTVVGAQRLQGMAACGSPHPDRSPERRPAQTVRSTKRANFQSRQWASIPCQRELRSSGEPRGRLRPTPRRRSEYSARGGGVRRRLVGAAAPRVERWILRWRRRFGELKVKQYQRVISDVVGRRARSSQEWNIGFQQEWRVELAWISGAKQRFVDPGAQRYPSNRVLFDERGSR